MAPTEPLYAGDISAQDAWALLNANPAAKLIDVRTAAEWTFVGLTDLSPLGRQPQLVEWQRFPDMARNPDFVTEVMAAAGPDKNTPVLFLCRSGARSRAAAIALAAAGYTQSFNIAHGFEGDPDALGQRGKVNGWKASGLPWMQT